MFCVRCGTSLPGGAAFCPSCGSPVTLAEGADPPAAVPRAPAGEEGAFPPASPSAVPVTPPAPTWETLPAVPARYGGFWRRFCAYLVDGFLLNLVMVPLGMIAGVSWFEVLTQPDDISPEWIASYLGSLLALSLTGVMLNWLYAAFLLSSTRQGTVGQWVLGLRVTDMEGRRISFARATGRHFATMITGFTIGIGYLIQLFTSRRQTLHDLVAGTLVVR